MASYGNMRDAYSSIYSGAQPKDPIIEAIDTLLSNGIINEKEVQSLMEREKGKYKESLQDDLAKMSQQLKVSNKPRAIPPNAPPKGIGDKKVPGMMDHSKRND